ncbi:rod shape-determining protein MreC [Patescibacteria group bacterium]|nr:rod shape-determining protein MreC [Patescibacteria group bacterium]
MKFKSINSSLFLLVSVILVVIFVVLNSTGLLSPLTSYLKAGLAPVQSYFYGWGERVTTYSHLLVSIRQLDQENKALEEKVRNLYVSKSQVKSLTRENKMLREQLSLVRERKEEMTPAFIISRDPNNLFFSLGIDKGSSDGIVQDMPVVLSDGVLIGQVLATEDKTASILPVVDSRSKINAEVVNSGATGIITGEHNLALVMDMIPQNKEVKPGDLVATSGIGQLFPRGLLLGEVEEVSNSDNALFQKAKIKPLFNFQDLRLIFVITSW